MEVAKGNIHELFRGRNNLITIEEELKLLKDNIMSIDNRLESISKKGEEVGDLSSRKTESESQNDKLEDIKIMANSMLDESLNKVFSKVDAHQEEFFKLLNQVADLGAKMNKTNANLADVSSEVSNMKMNLNDEHA